jgi:hypothetical protein
MAATTSRNVASEIAFLTRALKAPSLAASVERLAERARAESWTHEEFLAACLQREVAAREAHGGEGRIRAARFPARKSLEEFDFDHQRSLKRETIAHLGTLDFVASKENVVFLAHPEPGRPTCPSASGSGPARPDTGSRSPPQPGGCPASLTPTTPGASRTNWSNSAGSRC